MVNNLRHDRRYLERRPDADGSKADDQQQLLPKGFEIIQDKSHLLQLTLSPLDDSTKSAPTPERRLQQCCSSEQYVTSSVILLSQPLILHPHHHFLQTRLAGSCTAELQACTVFRK